MNSIKTMSVPILYYNIFKYNNVLYYAKIL